MESFFNDVKHAIRMFFKSPSFAIASVAALALGIGATTAVFSIVNTVLLKPLHIPDPGRLVVLATSNPDGDAASPAEFVHWNAQSSVIENVSAAFGGTINYTGGDVSEQWQYTRASANIFRCFGIPVLRGRVFAPAEDLPNGPLVALISQALWKRRFAADPHILGKKISLNGLPHTVIGIVGDVSAIREYGPFSDVYVPFQIDPHSSEQGNYFDVFARLKRGVTLEQARARLQASTAAYRTKFPNALERKDVFTAKLFRENLVGDVRPLMLVLLSAVSLVLLMACANVANLLLVRAAGRRREIAVRMAIGAGRGRVVRQLLTESLLLSLVGGALGLLLGYGGIRALLAVNTAGLPLVGRGGADVGIDWRVMGFALLVSLATGIVFGLFPAMEGSRTDLNSVLKNSSGHSGTGLRQNKARGMLVVSEVSLAVVLLVGSALLIRSFVNLYSVDPGFDRKNVLTMNVLLAGPKYSKSAAVADTVRSGQEHLRSLPGVLGGGATCCLPLGQGTYDMTFSILGRTASSLSSHEAGWETVSPGYFEVFKIPMKRGRTFSAGDNQTSPAVVLINERMAEEYWKGSDPLGERIAIGRHSTMKEFKDEPVRQIVGIVADVRSEGLNAKPRATMYVPQAQLTDAANVFFFRLLPMAWVVRTQGPPHMMLPAIREQLRQVTGLPVTDVVAMDQVVWAQTGRERFNMLLMSVFGGAALLLAAIGIFGLIAYTVEQRRHEIGIRMALGAESSDVRNMLVRQGMTLVLAGVFAGLGAAWALARSMESLLYGVTTRDPMVFVAVPMVLSAVALVAVLLPAKRASRIDPLDSLRYE